MSHKISIIHLTDFHYKEYSTNKLTKATSLNNGIDNFYIKLEEAIANHIVNAKSDVFIVLLTGDYYDRNVAPQKTNYLLDFISKLKNKFSNIYVYACAGNHDICSSPCQLCETEKLQCICEQRCKELTQFFELTQTIYNNEIDTLKSKSYTLEDATMVYEKEIFKDQIKTKDCFIDMERGPLIQQVTNAIKSKSKNEFDDIIHNVIDQDDEVYSEKVIKNGKSYKNYLKLCETSNLNTFDGHQNMKYLCGKSTIKFEELIINIFSLDTSNLSTLGDHINYRNIIPKIKHNLDSVKNNEFNILIYHHPIEYWDTDSKLLKLNDKIVANISPNISRNNYKDKVSNDKYNIAFCGHIHLNSYIQEIRYFTQTTDKNIFISGFLEFDTNKNPHSSFTIFDIIVENEEYDLSINSYTFTGEDFKLFKSPRTKV